MLLCLAQNSFNVIQTTVRIIIIIIKMQDLEWHIIIIIAGALYTVKSRVAYKRSFKHDSLELSTEDAE